MMAMECHNGKRGGGTNIETSRQESRQRAHTHNKEPEETKGVSDSYSPCLEFVDSFSIPLTKCGTVRMVQVLRCG